MLHLCSIITPIIKRSIWRSWTLPPHSTTMIYPLGVLTTTATLLICLTENNTIFCMWNSTFRTLRRGSKNIKSFPFNRPENILNLSHWRLSFSPSVVPVSKLLNVSINIPSFLHLSLVKNRLTLTHQYFHYPSKHYTSNVKFIDTRKPGGNCEVI